MSRTANPFLEELTVLRAQTGDRQALETVLERLQAPLYRVILGIVVDTARAEDALQEALFKVARKIGWLQDSALLLPWAYRIATREAFALVRKDRHWRHAEELEDAADPVEPERELLDRLGALPVLVADLPPASRAVVSLHYGQELSLPEVAAVLDVPLGTVKSRLAYGLRALRRHFEGAAS